MFPQPSKGTGGCGGLGFAGHVFWKPGDAARRSAVRFPDRVGRSDEARADTASTSRCPFLRRCPGEIGAAHPPQQSRNTVPRVFPLHPAQRALQESGYPAEKRLVADEGAFVTTRGDLQRSGLLAHRRRGPGPARALRFLGETRPPTPLGTLVDQRTADELGRAASLPGLARGVPAVLALLTCLAAAGRLTRIPSPAVAAATVKPQRRSVLVAEPSAPSSKASKRRTAPRVRAGAVPCSAPARSDA